MLREQLIELIEQAYSCDIDSLVDHLITNGVSIPVKCCDCKYMIKQMGGSYCKIWQQYNSHGDNGFCNYGERKVDNG